MNPRLFPVWAALSLAACAPATVTPLGYTVSSNVPRAECPPGFSNAAFPSSGEVRCEAKEFSRVCYGGPCFVQVQP